MFLVGDKYKIPNYSQFIELQRRAEFGNSCHEIIFKPSGKREEKSINIEIVNDRQIIPVDRQPR